MIAPAEVPPPPERPADLRPLEVGEEAWTVVVGDLKPSGGATVEGAARVVVLAAPDGHLRVSYLVRLLRVSGSMIVGDTRDGIPRARLYACADRAEHNAFGPLVRFLWRRDR